MAPDPVETFSCFRNRSLFILDPPLELACRDYICVFLMNFVMCSYQVDFYFDKKIKLK